MASAKRAAPTEQPAMYKSTYPIRVTYKTETCNCGCAGRDPHHQTGYKRVITLADENATEGTVKLPFSNKPVRVFVPKWFRDIGVKYWVVDTNNIEWNY
mgnify:CR=1 FL=1